MILAAPPPRPHRSHPAPVPARSRLRRHRPRPPQACIPGCDTKAAAPLALLPATMVAAPFPIPTALRAWVSVTGSRPRALDPCRADKVVADSLDYVRVVIA